MEILPVAEHNVLMFPGKNVCVGTHVKLIASRCRRTERDRGFVSMMTKLFGQSEGSSAE